MDIDMNTLYDSLKSVPAMLDRSGAKDLPPMPPPLVQYATIEELEELEDNCTRWIDDLKDELRAEIHQEVSVMQADVERLEAIVDGFGDDLQAFEDDQ